MKNLILSILKVLMCYNVKQAGIILIFVALGFSLWAQNPQFEWVRSMGSSAMSNYHEIGKAVTTDISGNIYTVGTFRGRTDFDPGPDSTILDSGGFYHIFVQKLDTDGNFLWAVSMGGSGSAGYGQTYNEANAVAVDANGNVYVTGHFMKTADFDPGPGVANLTATYPNNQNSLDIFVLKLDTNGKYVWAKAISGSFFEIGLGISVDTEKNVYVSGRYRSLMDFDPGPETVSLFSSGYDDAFVLKLDEDGNYQWVTSLGGAGYDFGWGVANDQLGNVYTTGIYTFDIDFDPGPDSLLLGNQRGLFIQKLDTNGNLVWAKSIEKPYSSVEHALTIDESNNVYVTGLFGGTVDFDPGPDSTILTAGTFQDIFILKLDADGNLLWAKAIDGNSSYLRSYSIAIDEQNNVYTAGTFSETIDFDPGIGTFLLTSIDEKNTFIQKLDTDGNFVWAGAIGGTGRGIHIDPSCDILLTGDYSTTTDFDPSEAVYNLTDNGTIDFYVLKFNGMCNALPIEMTAPLRVHLNNQTAILTWKTATETNNSGFEIQRSKDGIEWQRIGWQVGQGNSLTLHTYTYIDKKPLDGTSYYRLKQVDLNGDFSYSNVVSLRYIRTQVSVYPNPVQDKLYIDTNEQPIDQVLIFDMTGRQFIAKIVNNSIDVSTFPNGIYTIRLTVKDEDFYKKIIVE